MAITEQTRPANQDGGRRASNTSAAALENASKRGVVVLHPVNIWLGTAGQERMKAPIILSVIGVCMIAVSGWPGGQMVSVYRVGIERHE